MRQYEYKVEDNGLSQECIDQIGKVKCEDCTESCSICYNNYLKGE